MHVALRWGESSGSCFNPGVHYSPDISPGGGKRQRIKGMQRLEDADGHSQTMRGPPVTKRNRRLQFALSLQ